MQRDFEQNGGDLVRPSARKSIHSHINCPFAQDNNKMLIPSDENSLGNYSQDEDGIDEVDNIMSKLVNPTVSAKLPIKNKPEYNRRNSLKTDSDYTDEDNFAQCLSKSAPPEFPPYSNYSDNSEQSMYESATRSPKINTSNSKKNYNRQPINNIATQHRIQNNISRRNTDSEYSNIIKIILCCMIVAVVSVILGGMSNTGTLSSGNVYDEIKFLNDITDLGQKYKVGSNSILQVQTGISTIFKRKDTGSFMFVYNSRSDKFNFPVFNHFIKDISNAASRYLRNDSSPVHYIEVDGTKLEMKDHGELMEKFRDDLARTGVMLVKQVDTVPSSLAMAFHYYCDEYNPLVEKSAIFFTLNLDKCSHVPVQRSTHALIEKCLASKWDSLPIDNVAPLLTRVVSVIIDVTNAF